MEEEEDAGQAPTFGRVLKMERKRLGLTQTELAEKIGTSQQNVAGWEAGRAKPRREQLQKLIEFLNAQPPEPRNDSELRPSTATVLQALAMLSGPLVGTVLLPGIGPMLGTAVAAAIGGKPAEKRQVLLEDSTHSGGAEPWVHFSRAQAEPEPDDLHDVLPDELHQYLNRGDRQSRVDYWSDAIALEVKTVGRGDGVLNRAGLALHRLHIFRTKLEREGRTPPRHLYLALVFQEGPILVRPGSQVQQIQEDATLLNIGCLLTQHLSEVGELIQLAERGDLDTPRIEDHPDWGRF